MKYRLYRNRFYTVSALLAIVTAALALFAGTLDIQVRTVSYGGNYAPRNVGVIWIENQAGSFIRTVKIWANARKKHLIKWNAASGGNTVNAVSGATVTSHQTHTVTWDCQDYNGVDVPDGVYRMYIEYTEDNSKYSGEPPGQWTFVEFTKAGTSFTLNPPDEQYFKDIQLVYTPPGPQYTLTTSTVGSGSISLNPPGGNYSPGTNVELTANPDPGWIFDSWSGDVSGTQNPINLTMNADKSVTATFTQVPTYTLTINTNGSGSVTLDPPGGTYTEGTTVTVTATPAIGWEFDGWTGSQNTTANPTTILMNGNKSLTANFSEVSGYILQVTVVGNGQVILNPTATGNVYTPGTIVSVQAQSDAGWHFNNWEGDLTGTDSTQSITMDGHKQITAYFGSTAVKEIAAGSNTISAALAGAVPGDVFVLTSSGGVYNESGTIVIDKPLTIMAAPGLTQQPVWKSSALVLIDLKSDLTLEGIILDGNLVSDHAIKNTATSSNSLTIDHCEIRNFNWISVAQDPAAPFDSLIVRYSLLHHSDAGIYLRGNEAANIPALNYVHIYNSTFYNFENEGIRIDGFRPAGTFSKAIVSHITVNDCGEDGLYFKGFDEAPIVKNSIFTNNTRGVRAKSGADLNIANCDVWNNYIDYKDHAYPGSGTISADPMFANSGEGDFTLLPGSPCIGTADDGTDMGNPNTNWTTDISEPENGVTPENMALLKNYPNPFNPSTTIEFGIFRAGKVKLTVYNILGKTVRTLLNERLQAGVHKVTFYASDLPSGVYYYILNNGSKNKTGKMLLIK